MKDIKETGGLFPIDETGNLIFVTKGNAVRQNVEISLNIKKGDLFSDIDFGLDYFLLTTTGNVSLFLTQYKQFVLSLPNVKEVVRLTSETDDENRTLTIASTLLISLDDTTITENFSTAFTL